MERERERERERAFSCWLLAVLSVRESERYRERKR